jgi:hypothetical protein
VHPSACLAVDAAGGGAAAGVQAASTAPLTWVNAVGLDLGMMERDLSQEAP